MSHLSFEGLRRANVARLPVFKNKHGKVAHARPDGSDWSPAQWLQAVIGELGEYANVRKKFERGDLTFDEYKVEAAKELADVQTYLDILALRCLDHVNDGVPYVYPNGIDLGQATLDKFNEVSRRVGAQVFIRANGDVYRAAPNGSDCAVIGLRYRGDCCWFVVTSPPKELHQAKEEFDTFAGALAYCRRHSWAYQVQGELAPAKAA